MYILKLKEQLLKIQKLHNKQTSNLRNLHTHTHTHTHARTHARTHAHTSACARSRADRENRRRPEQLNKKQQKSLLFLNRRSTEAKVHVKPFCFDFEAQHV